MSALLLAAHGSAESVQARMMVESFHRAAQATGCFAEVNVCYVKEVPFLRDGLSSVRAGEVVILPIFAGSGYFSMELLPREMGLSGAVTQLAGRTIRLVAPIGEQPGVSDLIRRSADIEIDRHNLAAEDTGLVICGHGNTGNERSDDTTYRHARAVSKSGRFREVSAGFLDQEPKLEDVVESAVADGPVVIVPFLIGGGVHERVDVQRRASDGPAIVATSPFMLPEAADFVARYVRQISHSPDDYLATDIGSADQT